MYQPIKIQFTPKKTPKTASRPLWISIKKKHQVLFAFSPCSQKFELPSYSKMATQKGLTVNRLVVESDMEVSNLRKSLLFIREEFGWFLTHKMVKMVKICQLTLEFQPKPSNYLPKILPFIQTFWMPSIQNPAPLHGLQAKHQKCNTFTEGDPTSTDRHGRSPRASTACHQALGMKMASPELCVWRGPPTNKTHLFALEKWKRKYGFFWNPTFFFPGAKGGFGAKK